MFFNKKSEPTTTDNQSSGMTHCLCKNERGIFLTARHATWVVSLALIWSFFIFISGYFLGQRVVLEQFATRLEQDSLSDKIYSSLCTLYEVDNEGEVTDNDTGTEGEEVTQSELVSTQGDGAVEDQAHVTPLVQSADAQQPVEKKVPHYYAPLAGFGSAERAYAFANRCTQKNIKVVVKKKPSKSTKGRTHYWYQVVTQPYEDKKMLMAVLETIKRAEHIRTITIQEV